LPSQLPHQVGLCEEQALVPEFCCYYDVPYRFQRLRADLCALVPYVGGEGVLEMRSDLPAAEDGDLIRWAKDSYPAPVSDPLGQVIVTSAVKSKVQAAAAELEVRLSVSAIRLRMMRKAESALVDP
jgi:hypothetical protein